MLTKKALIVRLSKIYGTKKSDGTFIDVMAKKLITGKTLDVASDQIFNPTFINDVVRVVFDLARSNVTGLVNLCNPESLSRYKIAKKLAHKLGARMTQIRNISINDIRINALRPKNISMRPNDHPAIKSYNYMPIDTAIEIIAKNWL